MNVSAQPKISPFRYPGGKTRLVELVHLWLLNRPKTHVFMEPFAGGASIGLYVAAKRLVRRVRLVELDSDVSAVWNSILSSDYEWLCKRIVGFKANRTNVLDVLSSKPRDTRGLAFRTLVRNRFSRSGLLCGGAGIVRVGERGVGIASRWYPETLVTRIRFIHSLKNRISFTQGCGLQEILSDRSNSLLFIDPPYTATTKSVGRRLYRHSQIDHQRLFELLGDRERDFLMTHENSRVIRALAKFASLDAMTLPMPSAQNQMGSELLIGRNLTQLIRRIHQRKKLFLEPMSKLDFV